MLHYVPKEYKHDAKLVTLYNVGFKEGYYTEPLNNKKILDKQILTDNERLAYQNGVSAGKAKRRAEKTTNWKDDLRSVVESLKKPNECPYCGGDVSRFGWVLNDSYYAEAKCSVCGAVVDKKEVNF